MRESTIIQGTYDYWLVALSILIAMLASYAALDLAARVSARQKEGRVFWLFGGAVAMGTGIWSMHYTGMLAYRLPVTVYYHVPTVLLSLVAAIGASFIALFVVSREKIGLFHIGIGSLLMAAGISTMHYTGMAAMRLVAMHEWDSQLVWASVGVAWVVSLVGLLLMKLNIVMSSKDGAQRFSNQLYVGGGSEIPLKMICAATMGFAIPAMHYTAMAAVTYMTMHESPDLTDAVEISSLADAAIIVITLIVLASVFLVRFRSRKPGMAQVEGSPVEAIPAHIANPEAAQAIARDGGRPALSLRYFNTR